MSQNNQSLNVFKKKLANGLTILIQPMNNFPRVDIQLWYHTGSKHEDNHEKGMAHFIEHMLFKGTQKLSEVDINLITHKLSGYSNAFTSQDYTSYVFRFPSNVWQQSLTLLADCMTHARFDQEMMKSEVSAVIEELRMYRDDYQSEALENLTSALFPLHPYHYPIIGSAFHLSKLTQRDLLHFYTKHYGPNNATLVIVGDIDTENAFLQAQKAFEHIPNTAQEKKPLPPIEPQLTQQTTTLYRDVNQPWSCFVYLTPSIQTDLHPLADLIALILAGDKNAPLYKRLVIQEGLASDIECFPYGMVEQGMLCISVYIYNASDRTRIGTIITEEIAQLKKVLTSNHLTGAKKRMQLDFTFLIEQSEKRATFIGTHFVGSNNDQALSSYMDMIENYSLSDIYSFIDSWLNPLAQHATHVMPLPENQVDKLIAIQKKTAEFEHHLLAQNKRTSQMEQGQFVETLSTPIQPTFKFPQIEEQILSNGLSVIMHHNPHVPHIYTILNFKANSYYDSENQQGLFLLLLQLMTHETGLHQAEDFQALLQAEGIFLYNSFDSIKMYCLSHDLSKALSRLLEVVTHISQNEESISFLKKKQQSDLADFWDSPSSLVDQLAREHIYNGDTFYKNPLGTNETISQLNLSAVHEHFKRVITPQESSLIIIGDLSKENTQLLVDQTLGQWQGPPPPELPTLSTQHKSINLHHEINRDQTVLAFTAPTLSSVQDKDYYPLLLLDIILMGGGGASSHYRLFDLREQTGIFYTIEGSFLYGNGIRPSISLIKTIVTPEQTEQAQELIQNLLLDVYTNGVTLKEFEMAKNILLSSSVELFETNSSTAHTLLFLKKCMLPLNLFDKQGALLTILRHEDVNEAAKKFCNPSLFSVITVGRSVQSKKES